MHRAGSYDDEAATSVYAQHFDPVFGRRFAERALDSLVVVRGARVLDVACGTGIFARMAAHVVGPPGKVVGIDASPAAINAARRIDVTSIVEWRSGRGPRLPFDDQSFDVVACQHALHRFDDPGPVLEEMRRVLVPGGRVGIMTWGPIEENPAFAAQLDAIVKSGLDRSGVVEVLLDAFAYHRIEDLRELVHAAGFTDIVESNRAHAGGTAAGGAVGTGVPVAPPAGPGMARLRPAGPHPVPVPGLGAVATLRARRRAAPPSVVAPRRGPSTVDLIRRRAAPEAEQAGHSVTACRTTRTDLIRTTRPPGQPVRPQSPVRPRRPVRHQRPSPAPSRTRWRPIRPCRLPRRPRDTPHHPRHRGPQLLPRARWRPRATRPPLHHRAMRPRVTPLRPRATPRLPIRAMRPRLPAPASPSGLCGPGLPPSAPRLPAPASPSGLCGPPRGVPAPSLDRGTVSCRAARARAEQGGDAPAPRSRDAHAGRSGSPWR